jgi:hypothetical protein
MTSVRRKPKKGSGGILLGHDPNTNTRHNSLPMNGIHNNILIQVDIEVDIKG